MAERIINIVMRIQNRFALSVVLFLAGPISIAAVLTPAEAKADRTVLSPNGETLSANAYRFEFALKPTGRVTHLDWFTVATPEGIELETERVDGPTERKKRYSFNIQYPLTIPIGNLPTISLGVRDLFGTGTEHGAFYLAATRSVPLSDSQYKLIREMKLNAGVGTGRMNGLFFGFQAHLRTGLKLHAEVYRQRINVGLCLPISKRIEARAYSLDGEIFYGLSYAVSH